MPNSRGVFADLGIELNDFGVLNGARYRLRAEQFGEAARCSFGRLGMTDCDEWRRIGAFHHAGPDPEFVVARRNVFRIGANVKALNPRESFR